MTRPRAGAEVFDEDVELVEPTAVRDLGAEEVLTG